MSVTEITMSNRCTARYFVDISKGNRNTFSSNTKIKSNWASLENTRGTWGHSSFSTTLPYSIPHPPAHTTLSVLSGCPHASLPGAAGTLSVTLHHSALHSTVFALQPAYACVYVWETESKTAQLCMHVQTVCVHLGTRTQNAVCV